MIEKKLSDDSCDSIEITTAFTLIIMAASQRTQLKPRKREDGGASVYTGMEKSKSLDLCAWTAVEVLH